MLMLKATAKNSIVNDPKPNDVDMKRVLIFIQFLLLICRGNAQTSFRYDDYLPKPCYLQSDPSMLPSNFNFTFGTDYLQKSKNQKKAARILLGSGAGLILVSFIIPRGKLVEEGICIGPYCSDKYRNDGIKTALLATGGASSLISIPLFIASKRNRRKAMSASLNFQMESIQALHLYSLSTNRFPVAGPILHLGR